MRKTFITLFLILLLSSLFFFPQKSFAATSISVSGTPSTLDYQTDFTANISLNCAGCSDSYLRGVFYPSGTSYFGFTQDNLGNWNNSPAASCTSYFKVAQADLLSGTWSGTLKFKPDSDSSYYNGPGEYLFKVGRYTASCGSPTWSGEVTIAITGPTPTPSSSTSTSSSPSPSPSPSLNTSPKPSVGYQISSKSASVAGTAKLPKLLPSTKVQKKITSEGVLGSQTDRVPIYLGIIGLIFLIIASTILFKEKIRSIFHF